MIKNKYTKKLKTYLFFGLTLFFINHSFAKLEIINLNHNQISFFHIFLFILFTASAIIIQKNTKNTIKTSVFILFTLNFCRIVSSLFFLYKQGAFNRTTTAETDHQIVLNFFLLYFFYLFLEVFFLKKKQIHKSNS